MDDELPYRIPCCSEINTARHPINPFLSKFRLPSLPALPDPWTHREIGPRDPDRWLLHGVSHKEKLSKVGDPVLEYRALAIGVVSSAPCRRRGVI